MLLRKCQISETNLKTFFFCWKDYRTIAFWAQEAESLLTKCHFCVILIFLLFIDFVRIPDFNIVIAIHSQSYEYTIKNYAQTLTNYSEEQLP